MLVSKAFVYRLYPNTGQTAKLEWTLERCRELYNAARNILHQAGLARAVA